MLNFEIIALALGVISGRLEELSVDEYLLLGLSPKDSTHNDVLKKAESVLEITFRLLGNGSSSGITHGR